MTDSRSIELSIEVPVPAEEAWQAVATGPGITSWFVPVDVDEHVGGKVRMHLGDVASETGTVTVWEPPHRIVIEGTEARGRRISYEWLVEPAAGGGTVVRLVNAGFGTDAEWEADFRGMTGGWTIFLENLRLHLTHFPGRRASAVVPVAMLQGPHAAAWSAFCAALGVPATMVPGDRVRPSGEGVPPLSGVVERVVEQPAVTACLLLVDEPMPGTGFLAAEGDGDQVACSVYLYLYGDDAAAAAAGAGWEAWMAATFPAPPELRT